MVAKDDGNNCRLFYKFQGEKSGIGGNLIFIKKYVKI